MDKKLTWFIFVSGTTLACLASGFYLELEKGAAFLIGYGVFTIDVFAISSLSRIFILEQVRVSSESKGDESKSYNKGLMACLGLMKIFIVTGVLYLAIVKWNFPGLYLAGGSLFSLVLFCLTVIISRLKQMAQGV